jgi:hypothetical protein
MVGKADFLVQRILRKADLSSKSMDDCKAFQFFDYDILLGLDLNHAQCVEADSGIFLIGDILDPSQPTKNNEAVIRSLMETKSRKEFIAALIRLSGEYVLMVKQGGEMSIFPDACAQFTCYCAKGLDSFASTPGLLSNEGNMSMEALSSERYHTLYASFLPTGSGRGMLPANHYADLNSGKLMRFFPTAELKVEHTSLDNAVATLAKYLQGLMKALSLRAPLAMAITAGYDTRLLLSAINQADVSYFLYQHPAMPANHHDIVVGQGIAAAKGVERNLINYSETIAEGDREAFARLWQPRWNNAARIINGDRKHFAKHIVLNGNIGEIARSYFGKTYPLSGAILAKLLGKKGDPEVIAMMEKWLDSFPHDALGNENVLDLLYWEEKMANWAAHSKTEYRLAGKMLSPLNNHNILITLLGVEKKYRSYYRNKLFEAAIAKMDPRLSKFSYNPDLKSSIIKSMQALGVYNLYKDLLNKYA